MTSTEQQWQFVALTCPSKVKSHWFKIKLQVVLHYVVSPEIYLTPVCENNRSTERSTNKPYYYYFYLITFIYLNYLYLFIIIIVIIFYNTIIIIIIYIIIIIRL